jgi:hypothetical protein
MPKQYPCPENFGQTVCFINSTTNHPFFINISRPMGALFFYFGIV